MVTRALLVLAVLLAAGGRVARAQEDDAQASSRALYDEGSGAYKAGNYPRAIEKFLAAYELSHAPAILFNIAQAYRLASDCDRALLDELERLVREKRRALDREKSK